MLKIDYFVYKLYKNSFVQNVNMFALCIEKNAKIRIIIIEARDGKQAVPNRKTSRTNRLIGGIFL